MKISITFFFIIFIGLGFLACEKDAGKGGTSKIRGKVIIREYNRDFTIQKTPDYAGAREDVFIIYGNNAVYGDKFEANYNGVYEFDYLREGSYTIFAYSKDSTKNYSATSELIPIIRQVEVTGKDQTVEVPDIIVLK